MYYVPDGTEQCGYYECKECGSRFLEYIPELCTERHTGWLNIAGSINKPQRIGTRYSAGVLAESAIFTI